MLASLRCGNHLRFMRGIRGGDNHGVHLRAPQQGIEVVIHLGDAMLLSKSGATRLVATQNRHQACPVDRLHGRDEGTLGNIARAQQRNTERHGVFLPKGESRLWPLPWSFGSAWGTSPTCHPSYHSQGSLDLCIPKTSSARSHLPETTTNPLAAPYLC